MQKTVEEITHDVRMLIDENEDNSLLISETDEVANGTDEIIRKSIIPAIDRVNAIAPTELLSDVTETTTLTLTPHKKGKAAAAPEHMHRFIYADAQDWDTVLYEAISNTDERYEMQSSEFAGIRGSASRPVVALVPGGGKKLRLEVYSTAQNDLTLGYVKRASMTAGKVEIAEAVYEAALCEVARYYMVSVGEAERARYYEQLAMEQLGMEPTAQ